MQNIALKKLFDEYSSGTISTDEYRNRRTQLIDEITGEITVRNGDFSPPTNPLYQPPHVDSVAITAPKSSAKLPIIIAVIIAIAFIVVASVTILNNVHNGTDIGANKISNDLSLEENPAKLLAVNFLKIDQWQVSDIDIFISNWKSLSKTDREYANTATWFRELSDTVAHRITEQRALADLGDKDAKSLEKHLQKLSATLTSNK